MVQTKLCVSNVCVEQTVTGKSSERLAIMLFGIVVIAISFAAFYFYSKQKSIKNDYLTDGYSIEKSNKS